MKKIKRKSPTGRGFSAANQKILVDPPRNDGNDGKTTVICLHGVNFVIKNCFVLRKPSFIDDTLSNEYPLPVGGFHL